MDVIAEPGCFFVDSAATAYTIIIGKKKCLGRVQQIDKAMCSCI